jgi:hypothetical protein
VKAPPVVRFKTNDPLQEYYVRGGEYYSVARLADEAKDLVPFNLPLAALDLDSITWNGCNLFELAYHVKRVEDADLSIPIIPDWNGSLADGRHRVIKSLVLGKRFIKAVRITWTIPPDRVDSPD